ncbi:hypothetical protein ACFR9U_12970 [Halorientalis brevis]|uniref:Uncharacterized protein n=1 Tax=Halorientalis brevis TaxID=1126241 RepID=A0ABD6CC93_9EURY|nr:hypothetical protein [Halorientalis brevis]
MATATRSRLAVPEVDLKLLVATCALIAAEGWFLTTQTQSVVLPLIWMAPMDLFLLVAAVDETVALGEVAMILFFGRFILLPFMFLAPMNSFLLFYGLFMAPVDVVIVGYVLRSAGNTALGRAAG